MYELFIWIDQSRISMSFLLATGIFLESGSYSSLKSKKHWNGIDESNYIDHKSKCIKITTIPLFAIYISKVIELA